MFVLFSNIKFLACEIKANCFIHLSKNKGISGKNSSSEVFPLYHVSYVQICEYLINIFIFNTNVLHNF